MKRDTRVLTQKKAERIQVIDGKPSAANLVEGNIYFYNIPGYGLNQVVKYKNHLYYIPMSGTLGNITIAGTLSAKFYFISGVPVSGSGSGAVEYKFIKATGQSEGDLHLSDSTNWGISKAHISTVIVETSSTDWDLWLLQNDNGYSTDDANIGKRQLYDAGNGNLEIDVDSDYEDEDASGEVHLYWVDNSGSNTADIYIIGYELA